MASHGQRILTLVADPETGPERLADRLYHDLLSPPEVRAVREQVRKFASRSVAPIAHRIADGDEQLDGFPRDVFEAMARDGLFRIPFAPEVGGEGFACFATATAVAVEELAYYSNSVAAMYTEHCVLAGVALEQGSEQQRRRWLRPIVDGEIVGSFACTEPGVSGDLSPETVQTVAVPDGDEWLLTGRKRSITNSVVAGVLVVLARTDAGPTTFIVPAATPGVTIGTPERKLGNRGQVTADVMLDDVRLGPDAVLGAIGGGLRIAQQTLTWGRICHGAAGVGMAQAAFDHTVEHLRTRHASDGSSASKQHWQFVMANYAADLETIRSLYLKAALHLDAGETIPEPEAAMARMRGTDLAARLARDAVQAFGGLSLVQSLGACDTGGPMEAIYRDSTFGELHQDDNEIQRGILTRHIFDRKDTR
ncbi:acyl-CoA dehydrogenase family protein [Rhodococcus pyridinivorans]|uniref:acyl-CoA dehydrogenase family protein n=1 Tax=Rhodococcus pyridinivorans TaxID=103816 RepID=UPI00110E007C|nr:acyl-CoA dehydrogenase family protein [Rhodococcus pyridinivorans]